MAPDSARGSDTAGWFLNSGVNVAKIGAALAAAAALMALRRSADLLGAVWFAAGATTAMGGVLLAVGPGTIFPIVSGIGMLTIGAAVVVGTAAGLMVRVAVQLVRRLRKRGS